MIIKTEQGKTTGLTIDLSNARSAVTKITDQYGKDYQAYNEVMGDLMLMRDKISFLSDTMRQTMDLILPETAEAEGDAVSLLMMGTSKLGLTTNVLWLSTAPMALSMAANFVVSMKWAKTGGKIAKFAKASKAFKVVRFAKIAGPAALALEIGMFAYAEGQAKHVNKDLRKAIQEFGEAEKKAKVQLAKLHKETSKAKAERAALLKEANVTTVEDYVYKFKEAFVDVGRLQETLAMARRMLRAGMDEAAVMDIINTDDAALVARVAQRIKAEEMFVAGQTVEQVAETLGIELGQAAEVASVVDARGGYVRGQTQAEISEATGIANGTYVEIETNLDRAMAAHWSTIEEGENLDALANETLTRPAAFLDLRLETQGKVRLAAKEDIGAVADALGVERDTIVFWASQLPLQREEARMLKEGDDLTTEEIAVETRLTRGMVAAA